MSVILGVSRWTVYDMAAKGVIPKLSLGRRVRFLPSQVLEAISKPSTRATEDSSAAEAPESVNPPIDIWAQPAASLRRRRAA